MKKEYTKLTVEKFDENMQPTGETEEHVITSLVADEGKVFHCKTTGFTGGTRIDLGTEDSEENYIEVDAPATEADYLNALAELGGDTSEEG